MRRQLDLLLESRCAHRARLLGRQQLHHDAALQPLLRGEKNSAHTAATELSLYDERVTEGLLKLGL
jgi:hypothetical protein